MNSSKDNNSDKSGNEVPLRPKTNNQKPKTQSVSFVLQKKNALTKKDKSHEQKWDDKINPLCDKINKYRDLYTTSSCSGRIIIIPDTNKKLKQGFLFKSHNKITFNQLTSNVQSLNSNFYWFRMEPAALHIACKELETAQKILTKARNLGWKKSGIISIKGRYIIELFAPELLIAPITSDLQETYLQLLVTQANKKLQQTWTKIKELEVVF